MIGQHIALSDLSHEAAEHGDANIYILRTDFALHYGLSNRTELTAYIPLVQKAMRTAVSDEHHRSETIRGPGDVRLTLKHFVHADRNFQIAGIAGLSLPTGRTNILTRAAFVGHEEAEALGITVPRHTHLQLGTGTVDPILGVEALYRSGGRWMLYGTAVADIPLYRNHFGYRTSPSLSATFGPAAHLRRKAVIAGFLLNIIYSGRDSLAGDDITGPGGRLDGKMAVPNTGRMELSAMPTLTWTVNGKLTINLSVNLPVYTRIKSDSQQMDIQLTEPAGAFLGFSWKL